jgi:hypothetical protein
VPLGQTCLATLRAWVQEYVDPLVATAIDTTGRLRPAFSLRLSLDSWLEETARVTPDGDIEAVTEVVCEATAEIVPEEDEEYDETHEARTPIEDFEAACVAPGETHTIDRI